MSFWLPSDLSEADEGVGRLGALHQRGEAHVVSHQQLVHGLQLKPPAVTGTVCGVDAFKVPALQGAGALQIQTDFKKGDYKEIRV